MAKPKKKGSSADNLRKGGKSSDASLTKETPSKDMPVNEPSSKGPLVAEAPQKGPPTKGPPATGEKLPDAAEPSTKAISKLPAIDSNNKLYFPSRDRNARTGRDYIPAVAPRGEYVPAPFQRQYFPTASERLYPQPRTMDPSFSVGPAAIRKLELSWTGVDGDVPHSPNPPSTRKCWYQR
jgi:hypothetical protein